MSSISEKKSTADTTTTADRDDNPGDMPSNDKTAYGDEASLTALFGDHPRTKMIVAFLGDPTHDLNAQNIADSAGLSKSAVYKHIDQLEELGIISKSRTVSGSQMYQLNKDDPLVEQIGELQVGVSYRLAEANQ